MASNMAKLKNIIKCFVVFVVDFLGIKYIWYKFTPNRKRSGDEPRTIILWLMSISVALYGIAST